MKRTILLCACLAVSGVASAKGGDVMKDAFVDDQAKITKILQDIVTLAAKKDVDKLDAMHSYGPKFTKFEDDQLGRQDSEASKKGERDGILGVKSFAAKIENLKVDVFGTAAVATMILDYTVDTGKEKMAGKDRSTVVFAKDAGGTWKIVHEHHSPLKNPS
jgi:ketosteroid isomerase-like protein